MSFSSIVIWGTVAGVPGTVRLGEVDGVEWGSEDMESSRFGLSGSVWISEGELSESSRTNKFVE